MLTKWFNDESGQALSEYGLLLAVIGLAVVGAIYGFRDKIKQVFTDSAAAIK